MARIKQLRNFGLDTNHRTYVIAEIGINHGGDVDTAKLLIDSAAKTGCDAVKFQTYLTEKRAPKGNQAVFDILKKCELPFDDFAKIKVHAESQSLTFFSTPFDSESLEYLETIGTELYKIASFDVVNQTLVREIALTGKPVIMSVGMVDHNEIQNAYEILYKKTNKLSLLHCVSSYPLEEENANLAAIYELQDAFDCVVGYSDHTPDIKVPLYAVAAGAQVIEKHYKIDRDMDCIDGPVSITEDQMKTLVDRIRETEQIFGDGVLGVREVEQQATIFRRMNDL